ncbi:MAG: hypothetical protein ACOX6D_05640 [Thermoguttaceae bacterium]|jgi:hypothetical protein
MSFRNSSKTKAEKPKKGKKSKRGKKGEMPEFRSEGEEQVDFTEMQPESVKPVVPKRLDIYALILLLTWLLLVAASILAYLDIASYK